MQTNQQDDVPDRFPQSSAETPADVVSPVDAVVEETEVSVSIGGDIMTHGPQMTSAYDEACKCYNFVPVFDPVCPLFRDADLAIANLETTLPGKDFSGYPKFGAPDEIIDAITHCGINVLTTANNHCVDKEKHGLVRTLQVLDTKGVGHLGTYRSLEEYEQQRVFIYEKNKIRIALLNYTYGTNMIPTPTGAVVNRIVKESIAEDIGLARAQNVDFVVVLYHFGKEYLNQPDAYQREMVDFAVAEGADLVIGGHPHHVQPYSLSPLRDKHGESKTRLIAYSLGNFVSAQRERYTDGGMVLRFKLKKQRHRSNRVERVITDVHHKLVWVYIKKDEQGPRFFILPIEQYLAGKGTVELPDTALAGMRSFANDVEAVLSQGLVLPEPDLGASGANQ